MRCRLIAAWFIIVIPIRARSEMAPLREELQALEGKNIGQKLATWFIVIGVFAVLYSTLYSATGANSASRPLMRSSRAFSMAANSAGGVTRGLLLKSTDFSRPSSFRLRVIP